MDRRELIRKWMHWKSERENGNYSFKALAEDAGLNANYLSNVMTGIRNPGLHTLTKIADALGVTLAEFYAGPSRYGVVDGFSNTVPQTLSSSNNEDFNPVFNTDSVAGNKVSSVATLHDAEGDKTKPEKFGLKFSNEGHDGFDKLFSSFGFRASDFVTEEGGVAPIVARPVKEETTVRFPDDLMEQSQADDKITVNPFSSLEVAKSSCNTADNMSMPLASVRYETGSYTNGSEDSGDDVPLLPDGFRGDIGSWFSRLSRESDDSTFIKRRFSVEGERVFAVNVSDDSMAPEIAPGDVLFIDLDAPLTGIEGRIAFVATDNGGAIRRVFGIGGGVFHLIPANPRYAPSIVAKADVDVMKIVLWLPLRDGMF